MSQQANFRRAALGLAAWLAVCFGAAAVAGLFRPGDWYAQLQKPAWTPPNWLFGPVWTALYLMMAVAAWEVWRRGGFARQCRPLAWFLIQLAFNALWSWLFFGRHQPAWGLVDLLLLWFSLLATLIAFGRQSRLAGALLVPYLVWVTFAAALNFALWRMNPG